MATKHREKYTTTVQYTTKEYKTTTVVPLPLLTPENR